MIRFIVQKVVDRALLKKQQLPIQAVAYFVTSTTSSKTILLYEHYTIDGDLLLARFMGLVNATKEELFDAGEINMIWDTLPRCGVPYLCRANEPTEFLKEFEVCT